LLLDFLDLLEGHLDRRPDVSFDDWREGDQKVYVSDISWAREEQGWEPEVLFGEGIDRYLEWYENR
jgi:CDP-paratose 2-epimerase